MAVPHISRNAHTYKPSLDELETRLVPTVTYHGGELLTHVEVQPLFLGPDWGNYSAFYNQASQLSGFCNYLVHSSYMTMLTSMGYGVGQGSSLRGVIDSTPINKALYYPDRGIQIAIQQDIQSGLVAGPDLNRLYVVFVEDGVAVRDNRGADSISRFSGYHSAFPGYDNYGNEGLIHYAVIAHPGYPNGNSHVLSVFAAMTAAASHEIAEAVTDPNVNVAAAGWYDFNCNGEIADINPWATRLGPYEVQSVVGKNDKPFFPYNAARHSVKLAHESVVDGATARPLLHATVYDAVFGEHLAAR